MRNSIPLFVLVAVFALGLLCRPPMTLEGAADATMPVATELNAAPSTREPILLQPRPASSNPLLSPGLRASLQPLPAYTIVVSETWVTEPISDVQLYARVVQPDPALYPGEQFPAVVLVPGGTGDGAPMADRAEYQDLARQGFVVVAWNAPGRGTGQPGNLKSEGPEDCNGFAGQNALKSVIEFTAGRSNVDAGNLGVQTSSYGITMGAGALGRYPDLPVQYLVDMEGPSNNLITTFYYSGQERPLCGHWSVISDTSPANLAWWLEREAYRYIGNYRGYYLRTQAAFDHAQPPGIYTHTLEMNNTAVISDVPWVRVNGLEVGNPLSATYTATNPLWLPGRQRDYSGLATNYVAEMARRFAAVVTPSWHLSLRLPHDVDRLGNGHTLITDGDLQGSRILEVDVEGNVVAVYIGDLAFAHNADRLAGGHTLLSDSDHDRVLELDAENRVVWDSDGVTLSDGSVLAYPNDANWLAGDTLLITDRDNHRVIEIDRGGNVLWQFGMTGVPGGDDTHLNGPHNADRLANGNALIADSNNDRIVEVTADGVITWTYAPGGPAALNWPRDADRLANGHTLVTDSGNHRLVEVTPAGEVVWEHAAGLALPYDADRLANGNTLIADSLHRRVIEVDPAGRIVWVFPSWAADAGFVLATEMASTTVAKIDVATDELIGRATVGGSPGGLVADVERRWAYVAVQQGDKIVALQADSLETADLTIPGLGKLPIGLALTSDGGTLLVTTRGDDGFISPDDRLDVVSLDTSTWPPTAALLDSIPTGLHPINACLGHSDRYAVVTVRNEPAILIVDLQSYSVVGQAPALPPDAEPEGCDVHPTANVVYATLHGPASTIEVVDLDALAFVNTVPILHTPPARPSTGSFTPDGGRFYVSGQTINRVLLFEVPDPLNPIQNMPVVLSVGPQPHFMAYLPGDRAYVANTNNGQPTGSISIVENYSGTPTVSGPILTNLGGPLRLAYFPAPCLPLEGVEIAGPAGLQVRETGVYSASYTPITATFPVTITWGDGTLGPTAMYSWTVPGTYTLAVTASNGCGEVTATFSVAVCQPVEGVGIEGPAGLLVGEVAVYTASYTPLTATSSVTFTWSNGMVGPTASYSWTTPGSYTLTVTVTSGCGSPVGGLFVVAVCQPLEGVVVDGPDSLWVGEVGLYTATYSPLTTTPPVTFTWNNGRSFGIGASIGPTATYSWTVAGAYTVAVTATSLCGEAFAALPVQVLERGAYRVYLPLIVKAVP